MRGSITRAVALGSVLASPAGAAAAEALWPGTVIEVTRPRLDSGVAVLEGDDGSRLRVDLAGAYLWAQRDGEPVAVPPDIIALLDARTLRPVSLLEVRVGLHLRLLTLPAPPALHDDRHRWGPHAYDLIDLPWLPRCGPSPLEAAA